MGGEEGIKIQFGHEIRDACHTPHSEAGETGVQMCRCGTGETVSAGIVSPQVPETGKREKCSEEERWLSMRPEELSTRRGQAERSPEKEQGSAGSWRPGEVSVLE